MGEVLFRASKVGALMVGGNTMTDKQSERLLYLVTRKKEAAKEMADPLTAKMEKELLQLQEKRDEPFELGETAKKAVEGIWLRNTFGYDEPVVTPQLMKGHLVEQDSINLLSKVVPSNSFRIKNKETFKNEFFSGHPDIVLQDEDYAEDIKSSWSLRTFFETRTVTKLYYGQAQVYMDLTGKRNFRLCYCLVPTPEQMIIEEEKRFFYKFWADYENVDYKEAEEKIRHNNNVISEIPEKDRVKVFDFKYDEKYMTELKKRVEAARRYYATLKLSQIKDNFVV